MVLASIPLRAMEVGDFDVLYNSPGEFKRNLERKGLSRRYKKHPMSTAQVR